MDKETLEKLEKLASLMERGILTKEEMESQKALLLGKTILDPSQATVVTSLGKPQIPPPMTDRDVSEGFIGKSLANKPPKVVFRLAALILAGVVVGIGLFFYHQNTQQQILEMQAVAQQAEEARQKEETARHTAEEARLQAEQAKIREEAARLVTEEAQRQEKEERRIEAKKPKFTAAVTRCDHRCSGLISNCTYAECSIQNIGGSFGIAHVDIDVDHRIQQTIAIAAPGKAQSVNAKFEGVNGSSCKCIVTSSEEYSE